MRHGENKYVVKLWMSIIPCVFLCHHGMRSMQATYYLYQLGFQNVKSLKKPYFFLACGALIK